ncbi:hypothetical protein GGS21DRAFT_487284 [Xylaria nigripes]|nr:hypothetical protein GGS21DRAFT_487284 [Xylaria nigripes]
MAERDRRSSLLLYRYRRLCAALVALIASTLSHDGVTLDSFMVSAMKTRPDDADTKSMQSTTNILIWTVSSSYNGEHNTRVTAALNTLADILHMKESNVYANNADGRAAAWIMCGKAIPYKLCDSS